MKSIDEQIANSCIHFNGIQNKNCLAGIEYSAYCRKLPCHKSDGLPCEKQKFPTEEEVKKEVEELDKHLEKMRVAMSLVPKIKKEHKGQNWQGIESCPVCGGNLHLSHAAYNGHVWGKCETIGCVSWMQ